LDIEAMTCAETCDSGTNTINEVLVPLPLPPEPSLEPCQNALNVFRETSWITWSS
jgi:hypothetical protein